ncbi:MAG: helix-turn-helix domain-containing protein [Archangium sp.]
MSARLAEVEPLWTVEDVARMLSMSKQWVYKHAELGALPCVRLGAALRFRPQEIREYLDAQSQRVETAKVLALRPAD